MKTTFITFYSFKGGVGRTMALANTALLLAGAKRRVLVIDCDLEAPGLTLIDEFRPHDVYARGFVDLVTDFIQRSQDDAIPAPEKIPDVADHVHELQIPREYRGTSGGSLHIMPAGAMRGQARAGVDDEYEGRLHRISFPAMYDAGVGCPFFLELRERLRKLDRFDYVLIDSRTGFSDVGGICTQDLPDALVILTGLNKQHVFGTVRVLERLRPVLSGESAKKCLFVASHVPEGDEEHKDDRIDRAIKMINDLELHDIAPRQDFDVHLPYQPRLSLEEVFFGAHGRHSFLHSAYQQLCGEVRRLAGDDLDSWNLRFWHDFSEEEYKSALADLDEIEILSKADAIMLLRMSVQSRGGGLLDKYLSRFFRKLVKLTPNDPQVYVARAAWLSERGKREKAEEDLRQALSLDAQSFTAHLELGAIMGQRGVWEDAERHFRHALRIRSDSPRAYFEYARMLQAKGDYELAYEQYQAGLTQESAWLPARVGCAEVLSMLGRQAEATQAFRKLLNASPSYEPAVTAYARHLVKSNQRRRAKTYYERSLPHHTEDADFLSEYAAVLEELGDKDEARRLAERTQRLRNRRREK